ncbi:MAG: mdoC [Verrucomicrobiales bacterium]|nr:mdoC [Verrucomicrobiales bacterium]
MNASIVTTAPPESSRLHYLDATRAFALLLGVVFHSCLSFTSSFVGWAVQDISTSPLVGLFMTVSHTFRMEAFFLLAGLFSHLAYHRNGAGAFVRTRVLRIVVPFVVGWFILRPLVVSGWIMGSASLRGSVDIWAGLRGGFQTLSTLPDGIFVGSHLWFLYYMAMITALVVVMRGTLIASGFRRSWMLARADAFIGWLAESSICPLMLAVPTAAALWFMNNWGMDTPDQSLKPHLPVLLVYTSLFVLGWMLGRQRELIEKFSCLTPWRGVMAGIGIATVLLLGDIERDFGHAYRTAAHIAYALGYALTMWSLVFLTLGVFRKLCGKPHRFTRFVADSSYWMYLIHLPIVVWLQVAIAEVPLHWSLKLGLVSAITIAISLLTYDLFVRSTIIGRVLNGQRRERVMLPWVLNAISFIRTPAPQKL